MNRHAEEFSNTLNLYSDPLPVARHEAGHVAGWTTAAGLQEEPAPEAAEAGREDAQ